MMDKSQEERSLAMEAMSNGKYMYLLYYSIRLVYCSCICSFCIV